MRRSTMRTFATFLLCGLAALVLARQAACGTTVNGVSLDTILRQDDGSLTAVVIFADRTYNVKTGQSFPDGTPAFAVVSLTDTTVTLRALAGGDPFLLETD